jgi:hypothetical protein
MQHLDPSACLRRGSISFFETLNLERMKILLLLAIICFSLQSCQKGHKSVTYELSNKPLAVVKRVIRGKWRLHYSVGGIVVMQTNYDNSYITFGPGNAVLWMDDTAKMVDTVVQWEKRSFTATDSIYVMTFDVYPLSWTAEGIYSDTLILDDFYHLSDGSRYFLTRSH